MNVITNKLIDKYKLHLMNEEKALSTQEKYIRDVRSFMLWANGCEISKIKVLEYKHSLMEKYAPVTINAILSSLNSFFDFNGWYDCKVKTIKIQKQLFISEEKSLNKKEYMKLLEVAKKKKNKQLYYLMQTICSTGIRVSELRFITVEAVKKGKAIINCKGKIRTIILPKQLCQMLKTFVKERKIKSGSVFITKTGKPLNRSNIWRAMKKLCKCAGIAKSKVFPHNLRKLFAVTYYSMQKDVVRLSEILGHERVDTTRIYTVGTGSVHRKQIQKLGLLAPFTTK